MENKLLKGKDDVSFYERFSHELRTALTGVLGFSEYVENSINDPMMKFAAQAIHNSGKEVLSMTSAYFDFLRFKSGEVKIQLSTFSAVEVITEVMHQVREIANVSGIKLVLNCDGDAWAIRIVSDFALFRRMIDLVLKDFVSFANKGDLIQIEVLRGDILDHFQIRFLIITNVVDARRISLCHDFWKGGNYSFEKQEGPGVRALFAKEFIKMLSGHCVNLFSHDKHFSIDINFPIKFSECVTYE